MNKKLFRSIVGLLVIAALLALAVLKIDALISFFNLLKSIVTPIVAGMLIALFLDKPYTLLRKLFLKLFKKAKRKYKIATGLSVAITFLLVIAFISIFIIAVVPEITASVSMLLANLSSYIENIQNTLNGFLNHYDFLRDNIEPFDFTGWDQWILSLIYKTVDVIKNRLPQIFDITMSIAGIVTNAILSIIISIYLLLGRKHLKWQAKKAVYAFLPKQVADIIREIVNLTARTLSGYISGRIVDSVIVGLLCFAFMKIFGFEYAALISFIIGVTNFIPMLGPFIGAIPSAFLLLLVNPAQCFWFILFVLALQQFDSNVLDPRISGEATGLPALWVLVSITIGGSLFGFLGFILSVPVCAVLYTLTRRAVTILSERKGIPLDDEPERDPEFKKWTLREIRDSLRKKREKKENKESE